MYCTPVAPPTRFTQEAEKKRATSYLKETFKNTKNLVGNDRPGRISLRLGGGLLFSIRGVLCGFGQNAADQIGTAHKKSRKQRIPGGRRTLATSGGDWLAMLPGTSSFQDSLPTDEQYVDCQNGSIRFRSNNDHNVIA